MLSARTRRACLVLEGSQDPRNVHAVLRTAEALGVQDAHLVAPRGLAAPVAAGVTQGAHEWLTVRRHDSLESALRHVRGEGRAVWAACLDDRAVPLAGLRVERPVALLFGNESEGLSEEARAAADLTFRIDLVGFSGSLNLSVAAAIVLWELRRQEVGSESPGDLAPEDEAALRRAWYERLVGPERAAAWLDRADEIRRQATAMPRTLPRDRRRSD